LISGATTISFASLALGKANFSKGFDPINKKEKAIEMEMAFVTENRAEDFKRAIDAGAIEFESIKEALGSKSGLLKRHQWNSY
jgi:hypothetical protein